LGKAFVGGSPLEEMLVPFLVILIHIPEAGSGIKEIELLVLLNLLLYVSTFPRGLVFALKQGRRSLADRHGCGLLLFLAHWLGLGSRENFLIIVYYFKFGTRIVIILQFEGYFVGIF